MAKAFQFGATSAIWLIFLAFFVQLGIAARSSFLPKEADVKFDQNYWVRWANDHTRQLDGGQTLQLVLDKQSGAGFASKDKYLFGQISMKIKLVPGESAGTVTAFYMSSETNNHDELDFEFLGNNSGQPYIVQTNVFANGKGDREQRIYLWFDPTADFHTYGFLWNPQQIMKFHSPKASFLCMPLVCLTYGLQPICRFYVDDVPIRVYKNNKVFGVDFPLSQPMGIYSSLWNGDDWATRGGLEKIKWNSAPFVASYRGFSIDACKWSGSVDACANAKGDWWRQQAYQTTSSSTSNKLKWVQKNYMIYDYCRDTPRFSSTKMPLECNL